MVISFLQIQRNVIEAIDRLKTIIHYLMIQMIENGFSILLGSQLIWKEFRFFWITNCVF